MALGGYYPFALEIWAEGVRVTPVKLYRKGVLQRDALTMLALNSRLPHLVEKDVQNMVDILELANTAVTALAARQTPAVYTQALDRIIADAAAQAQAALSALPHGEWHGESAPIHCCLEESDLHVTVRRDRFRPSRRTRFLRQFPRGQRLCEHHYGHRSGRGSDSLFLPLALPACQ